jgi:chitosanase
MDKKPLIKKILLAFEQSRTSIGYDKIYTFNDGPNNIKQITVSFGITEYGNLKKLIEDYCNKDGKHKPYFEKYLPKIGKTPLCEDLEFISLLKASGSDPLMQLCQDQAFDNMYINRAYQFCDTNQLDLPLSRLVICDSYLQSGSILSLLRNKFSEKIPASGGNEKKWIESYCTVRRDWLKNHSRKILNKTIYRMNFMLDRIKKDDWELSQPPFNANGLIIKD